MNEERESLILNTAYKLWEADGKPGYWFGAKSDYYKSKALEKLNSRKKITQLLSESFSKAEVQPGQFLFFLQAFLGIIGSVITIISLVESSASEEQRRNTEIYQAWQVITAAYEQPGSGGRKEALEFLNSEPRRFPFFWLKWRRQSLVGLAVPKVYLNQVNLQQADLQSANFQEADLREANLQEADLRGANLQEAVLWEANLQEAVLGEANLQQAVLGEANLQQAYLERANLQQASLISANLQQAVLGEVNLQQASLERANLQQAYLGEANLQQASLISANLQQASLISANLQQADLSKADLSAANLQQADLSKADLSAANLQQAKNLTFKQIKLACNWEKAIYKEDESENQKYIEDLKKDKSSDPKEPPDCRKTKTIILLDLDSKLDLYTHPNYSYRSRSKRNNLLYQLKQNTNFDTLVNAIEIAGLTQMLEYGNFTLLAPNDNAFKALPDDIYDKFNQPENRAIVLGYHLIPGKVTQKDLDRGKISTIEGSIIVFSSHNGKIKLNDANTKFPSTIATNGIIIEIDKVLLPPDF